MKFSDKDFCSKSEQIFFGFVYIYYKNSERKTSFFVHWEFQDNLIRKNSSSQRAAARFHGLANKGLKYENSLTLSLS